MNKEMIWGYMLLLSSHMWSDELSPVTELYETRYTERCDVDLEVWDSTVKFIGERKFNLALIDVGDMLKYERHPEISAPDAWDKDFMKKKLDEMRALGIEPIPKLNFSTAHDTWLKKYRRMICTDEYYQVCTDAIAEVAEVFGNPRLFHLGFDEEHLIYPVHEMSIIRGHKLWWHDLNLFAKTAEKYGARPWIWSDYFWNHADDFCKNMSRDILQSNWYYSSIEDFPKDSENYKRVHAYELLDEYGYDQVPTPSTWEFKRNIHSTLAFCRDKLGESEHLKGFLDASWMFTNKLNRYTLMDDAERMYLSRAEIYPETL